MDRRDLDEYMETLWYLVEEGRLTTDGLQTWAEETFNEEIVAHLQKEQLIAVQGEKIEFTPAGYEKAKQIVRCHRLAERLLADVLGMKPKEIEQGACEFEHILAPEIVDSICTLLGHPSECPHGLKIPEGKLLPAGTEYAGKRHRPFKPGADRRPGEGLLHKHPVKHPDAQALSFRHCPRLLYQGSSAVTVLCHPVRKYPDCPGRGYRERDICLLSGRKDCSAAPAQPSAVAFREKRCPLIKCEMEFVGIRDSGLGIRE